MQHRPLLKATLNQGICRSNLTCMGYDAIAMQVPRLTNPGIVMLQENYINHRPSLARSDQQRLQILAKAADAFSVGDLVNRRVRQYGNWSLMPFAGVAGSVLPATYMRGMRETFALYPNEMNFPR